MELVSIFLFDLISNYYFASIHHDKKLPPPPPTQTSPTPSYPVLNTRPSTLTAPSITKTSSSIHHPTSAIKVDQSKASSYTYTNKVQVACQPDASNHLQQQKYQNSQPQQPNQALQKPPHPPQFICQFTQPISLISFKERVKLNKVHLETCTIHSGAGNLSVSCTIRVLNQSYDKSVIVRYTTDEWHSFTDSLASYRPGSCDGWSDKFTSTFSVGNQVKDSQTGQRIIFAIKYTYDGNKVCWDNNGGLNYTIKKVP